MNNFKHPIQLQVFNMQNLKKLLKQCHRWSSGRLAFFSPYIIARKKEKNKIKQNV
jgi:hypothetical protein